MNWRPGMPIPDGPIPLEHPVFMDREAQQTQRPRPEEVTLGGADTITFMGAVNRANANRRTSVRWIYPIINSPVDGILYGLRVEAIYNESLGPSSTFAINVPLDINANDFGLILDEAMPVTNLEPPRVEVTLDIVAKAREAAEIRAGLRQPAAPEPELPKRGLLQRIREAIGSGGGQ